MAAEDGVLPAQAWSRLRLWVPSWRRSRGALSAGVVVGRAKGVVPPRAVSRTNEVIARRGSCLSMSWRGGLGAGRSLADWLMGLLTLPAAWWRGEHRRSWWREWFRARRRPEVLGRRLACSGCATRTWRPLPNSSFELTGFPRGRVEVRSLERFAPRQRSSRALESCMPAAQRQPLSRRKKAM